MTYSENVKCNPPHNLNQLELSFEVPRCTHHKNVPKQGLKHSIKIIAASQHNFLFIFNNQISIHLKHN